MKVIDVSGLSTVDPDVWDALVIIHTWENLQPQVNAKQFIDRLDASGMHKLVVVTTSGSGGSKMDSVDAITSASRISDIKTIAEKVMQHF